MKDRIYGAIDLKSFYASVECMERGLDPMTTNLVVADASRTEKTICLAVSPSLRAYGISSRARLFEVVQKAKEINARRLQKAPGAKFIGSSYNDPTLKASPHLALDFITALPQMAHYIQWSSRIYNIYLKYIAPEDMHVYSIDEVFMDLTNYLATHKLSAEELIREIILDVFKTTGVTATGGLGTNLYLAKVAMDIGAKHVSPDADGVRIASLDEMSYRRSLWNHRPLTDFWRVGPGYARKLEEQGLFTMGDIARCSLGEADDYYNENLLYRLFGINAELLIDHAWGWEPCTIAHIKAYQPVNKSIVSGQVLETPYNFEQARLVVREMADMLSLDLVDKGLLTNQLVLTVGYDRSNLDDPLLSENYRGQIVTDEYGRRLPKPAHGTYNLKNYTASTGLLLEAVSALYDRLVAKGLLIRRLTISAHVLDEASLPKKQPYEQLNFLTDSKAQAQTEADLQREQKRQKVLLAIKKKYGKNAILKGMNLAEGATAKDRNRRIGGHRA